MVQSDHIYVVILILLCKLYLNTFISLCLCFRLVYISFVKYQTNIQNILRRNYTTHMGGRVSSKQNFNTLGGTYRRDMKKCTKPRKVTVTLDFSWLCAFFMPTYTIEGIKNPVWRNTSTHMCCLIPFRYVLHYFYTFESSY